MQIILLSKSAATARVLAVGRRWPLFIGLLLGVLLSVGLFQVGYLYGRGSAEPDLAAVTARAQAVAAERASATCRPTSSASTPWASG